MGQQAINKVGILFTSHGHLTAALSCYEVQVHDTSTVSTIQGLFVIEEQDLNSRMIRLP